MSGSPREPGTTLTGWLAPDGSHYPCEAWGHRALARKVCAARGYKREPIPDDDWRKPWLDDSDEPVDPEVELERRGFVRVHSADSRDPEGASWAASHHDPSARVTDAQVAWLRERGYGRALRRILRDDGSTTPR